MSHRIRSNLLIECSLLQRCLVLIWILRRDHKASVSWNARLIQVERHLASWTCLTWQIHLKELVYFGVFKAKIGRDFLFAGGLS